MTFRVAINKMSHSTNEILHNGRALLCSGLFVLIITCEPIVVSVVMLDVIMLGAETPWCPIVGVLTYLAYRTRGGLLQECDEEKKGLTPGQWLPKTLV
jgi:hypothetical protein